MTLGRAIKLLGASKPTAAKALAALEGAGVLREMTGRQRDRVYAYREYLQALTSDEP
ncbi:MAG: hypothetical protein AB1716_16005 [Planctomycetota bacterium]